MNRRILGLAVPSIVANITTPLLGLVDTAIAGHMGGHGSGLSSAFYIGAIAVGGVMFNMLYWLFGFLRGGTSGLAAQAYGSQNRAEQSLVLYRSLLIAVGVGVVMILLQWPLRLLLRWIVDADAATDELANRYFTILIYGAPAVLATYTLSGWFLGMQNSRMMMIVSIVINITNIIVSLGLVYGLGWQIAGIATGTLVAQWSGVAVALFLLHRYHVERPRWADVVSGRSLARFFRVNIEMMLRTVCLITVTVWFTKWGARQGAVILAVNTLLMQLFLLFSYFMDGFAFAGEALVGRFVGEGDGAKLRRCVKSLMLWGMAMSLIFTAIYFFEGEEFLRLLSADSNVIAASADYYIWAAAVPFAGFAAFVWDGVFIGATLTRQLLESMAAAMAIFFIVLFIFYPSMGNHALWLAFIIYLAMRGILQTLLYNRAIHRRPSLS